MAANNQIKFGGEGKGWGTWNPAKSMMAAAGTDFGPFGQIWAKKGERKFS